MRVSELVERSGVSLASIKYYLREGLLMPGVATSVTGADYDERHVKRLALIRALIDVVGMPVQKVKIVLALIDDPDAELFEALGQAVSALPPAIEGDPEADYPRARAALERLGQVYVPEYPAVPQLERALAAAESVGMPMSDERLEVYGRAVMQMGEYDIRAIPSDGTASALEYSVLGTAIYEPVVAALRRLAHQDVAARLLGPAGWPTTPKGPGEKQPAPRSAPR